MLLTWFGQSAFRLTDDKFVVLVDPHGDTDNLRARGMRFDYPPMTGVESDVLLITHEHVDHNGQEALKGEAQVFRSRAGTFESVVGPILGIASEHDRVAGTRRGDNTIFVFEIDGRSVCHLGDLGQPCLRPEQIDAIGRPDILFVPVGGEPTIGAEEAAGLIKELQPSIAIPMHYRTEAMDFLEPVDPFLEEIDLEILRLESNEWDSTTVSFDRREPLVVVPAPPA